MNSKQQTFGALERIKKKDLRRQSMIDALPSSLIDSNVNLG
jgi:hypothetical protein